MSQIQPVEELFQELIELPTADQRRDFLDRVCGEDPNLRGRLEGLLRSHEQAGSFLQDETENETPQPRTRVAGERIGPYKLRELIGEGGMGSVYVAEQEKPVRRKVALKVIKPGMDTKEVVARFEAERQALAMMDHPSIAKVFDAGMTDNGRPYFVMELINGVPITKYCDGNKLGIRPRLELFVQVCKAVHHAHQKGVIHRDVKPSNVLVTLHDGKPVPVIIDFGVAKATNQSLTDQTIYTRLNQVVGTTLYMSPEQAELSRYGVDTRTDVYSLGVLLYELLTGTTPFDRERLNTAAFDEVRRIIREEEPPKPSTRVSGLGKTATDISLHRDTEPGRLSRTIRGDLDWIVMKALEKDRNRRYESATRFAEDVENYLNDKVVDARPPSIIYQMRKLWRRNRAFVSIAAAVSMALVIGLGIAMTENREKTRVIEKLHEEVAGRLLNLALMGDLVALEPAVEDVKGMEIDPSLIDTIRGLGYLYAGDVDTGMSELDAATVNHPESTFAWSGLWLAALHAGEYQRMSEARLQIANCEGSSGIANLPGIEKFFLAQINRHTKPVSTVDDLSAVLERHPSWGAAYALRGRAKINVAKDNYEASDTLERFKDALSDFEKAAVLTDESEFVTVDYLLALLEACELGRYLGIDERCDEWMQKAKALFASIDQIERRGGYFLKARTAYLAAIGNETDLQSRWEDIVQDPNGSPIVKGANHLVNGRTEAFESLVANQQPQHSETVFLLRILHQAADPDQKAALDMYQDIIGIQEYQTGVSCFGIDTFLLAEDYTQAKSEAKRLLQKTDLASGRWNRRCLQYFGDQSRLAESEILEMAGPFVREQVIAYYSVGMVALAKGETDKATECFEKVLESGFLDHWWYCMAYVLNERLKVDGKVNDGE